MHLLLRYIEYYAVDNSFYSIFNPPSTLIVSPTIYLDFSDAKNRTTFAISSGSAKRFTSIFDFSSFKYSFGKSLFISVSIHPGATALTFTLGENSMARFLVRLIKAAFDAS